MKVPTEKECPGCTVSFSMRHDADQYSRAGIGRYGVASSECLAAFFELLTYESERFGYVPSQRLIVDAYAVQHPPHESLQEQLGIDQRLRDASKQSLAVHLIALYSILERKSDLQVMSAHINHILKYGHKNQTEFRELTPPVPLGSITVKEFHQSVFNEQMSYVQYRHAAELWALEAWAAWHEHHNLVKYWYESAESAYEVR